MKQFIEFVAKAFVSGLLILVPVYLSVLLLLKAMGKSEPGSGLNE